MVLEEKGLEYSIAEEKLSAPSETLLKLHPEGKVPLLVHGELVIPESAVITEYLEDMFPQPSLRPANAAIRAQIRLWTRWCDLEFKPDIDLFKYKRSSLSEAGREALNERVRIHLKKLSMELNSRSFLLGEEFTLADIHLFPLYRQLRKSHPDFANLFGTKIPDAWLERIVSRPSLERTMK